MNSNKNDMEHPTGAIGALFEKTGDYLETRIELLKLQAVNKSSTLASSIVSRLVLFLLGASFLLMLNIAIALWLGDVLGKTYFGFFIIAGFYAILGIVVYLCRHQWLKTPFSNMMIKKLLN